MNLHCLLYILGKRNVCLLRICNKSSFWVRVFKLFNFLLIAWIFRYAQIIWVLKSDFTFLNLDFRCEAWKLKISSLFLRWRSIWAWILRFFLHSYRRIGKVDILVPPGEASSKLQINTFAAVRYLKTVCTIPLKRKSSFRLVN